MKKKVKEEKVVSFVCLPYFFCYFLQKKKTFLFLQARHARRLKIETLSAKHAHAHSPTLSAHQVCLEAHLLRNRTTPNCIFHFLVWGTDAKSGRFPFFIWFATPQRR